MSPEDRKATDLRRLAAQIENDLSTSLELAKEAANFADKVEEFQVNKENPYIYAVAVTLQHFYTSLETAFKRVVKEMEGDLPSGESWYQDLLEIVCLEIEGVRPALISSQVKKDIDKLRRFRHVVRHGYEYELDWSQMTPLVESLERITDQIEKDFTEFSSFLLKAAEDLDNK